MNGSYPQQRRTTQHNVPSILLTDHENNELYGLLGRKCVTLATGVVQVHVAQNSYWQKVHTGACCFVKDSNKRSYYLRVYNIRGGHKVFEQEFYNQFKYNSPRPYFLTFDTDHCRAGLNFASEKEAFSFKQILDDKIRQKQEKKQARINSMRAAPSMSASHGGYSAHPQQPPPIQQQQPQQVQYQHISSAQEVKLTKTDDKKSKKKKKSKLSKSDIGHPSGFQHVGHVGWDPNKRGFDMNNIDSDLRQLFGEAGITEKDMEDKEKREFIYDFIEKKGGIEAVRQDTRRSRNRGAPPPPPPNRSSQPPPPPPSRSGPPPPPPQRGFSRAPPPPQRQYTTPKSAVPPPPSRNMPPPVPSASPPAYSSSPHVPPAGAPPPPPPPPPPPSAGMPPPPAPPAANANLLSQIQQGTQLKAASERQLPAEAATSSLSGRDALLDAIRKGTELKSVSNEPVADKATPAASGEGESLASALAWALQKRENAIHTDSGSDDTEDEDDDEWSD